MCSGAGLDGEAVTPQLENRLEAAYAYHLRNPDAPVVVSGGQGDGEAISEALAMERWLISRGVPADRILREEASTSTYENLTNAKALLDERSARPCRVALVTSGYHVYRASRPAKAAGLDASHLHADAEWYALPVRMLRECCGGRQILGIGNIKKSARSGFRTALALSDSRPCCPAGGARFVFSSACFAFSASASRRLPHSYGSRIWTFRTNTEYYFLYINESARFGLTNCNLCGNIWTK